MINAVFEKKGLFFSLGFFSILFLVFLFGCEPVEPDLPDEEIVSPQIDYEIVEEPEKYYPPQEEIAKEELIEQKKDVYEKEVKKELQEKTEKESYKIQVGSFRIPEGAKKEAEKLKEQNFPVIIEKKGEFSVVYVGEFRNKERAEGVFQELKTTYQDAILRTR